MSGERWEPVGVEAYRDHYEVSDLGRVRRSVPGKGTHPGKILTPTIAIRDHPVVKLSAGTVNRSFAVAPLVAAAFLPPAPPRLDPRASRRRPLQLRRVGPDVGEADLFQAARRAPPEAVG